MNNLKEVIDPIAIAKQCGILNINELMQLLRMDFWKFASWGGHAFRVINIGSETRGFRMKVSGHHHKGHVYIFVNGMDLFDVYYTNLQGVISKITEGLYFDMLADSIDRTVERIPAYKH